MEPAQYSISYVRFNYFDDKIIIIWIFMHEISTVRH